MDRIRGTSTSDWEIVVVGRHIRRMVGNQIIKCIPAQNPNEPIAVQKPGWVTFNDEEIAMVDAAYDAAWQKAAERERGTPSAEARIQQARVDAIDAEVDAFLAIGGKEEEDNRGPFFARRDWSNDGKPLDECGRPTKTPQRIDREVRNRAGHERFADYQAKLREKRLDHP